MAALKVQAYMKLRSTPLPPPDIFAGHTAVVTGATSRRWLDTTVHLLRIGAAEVIIYPVRREGEAGQGKGCADVVILNAGTIGTEYEKGPEGCYAPTSLLKIGTGGPRHGPTTDIYQHEAPPAVPVLGACEAGEEGWP
ncbi:short-chain dehydrogenase reductase protein [Apiospora phragmitis]|uniref:Short-chain dehydrogenase reductase protein n=1 Tax=Apiospora phragmitis TaxID=2905665 RepID=A0ABR1WT65_9PEZI